MKDDMLFIVSVALLIVAVVFMTLFGIADSRLRHMTQLAEDLVSDLGEAREETDFWKSETSRMASESLKWEGYFRGEQQKLHLLINELVPADIETYDPGPMECGWDMCQCWQNTYQTPDQKTICREAGFNKIYAMQIVCVADDNCEACLKMTTEGGASLGKAVAHCYKYALYP